jgi:nucleotide-binding universal stress UspA family protein
VSGSIICGIDGSQSAKSATRVARRLCSTLGLRLVFVHVAQAGSSDEETGAIAERLHQLAESCTEVDCGALWLLDVGEPVDRLIAAAADEKASLIVVGAPESRPSLLGSVAAEITRSAPCPVVVVPAGADENGAGGASRLPEVLDARR